MKFSLKKSWRLKSERKKGTWNSAPRSANKIAPKPQNSLIPPSLVSKHLIKGRGKCLQKSTFRNYLVNVGACSAGLAIKDVRRFFAPLFPSSLLPPSKYIETLQLNSTVHISRIILILKSRILAWKFKSSRVLFPPFSCSHFSCLLTNTILNFNIARY